MKGSCRRRPTFGQPEAMGNCISLIPTICLTGQAVRQRFGREDERAGRQACGQVSGQTEGQKEEQACDPYMGGRSGSMISTVSFQNPDPLAFQLEWVRV